MQAQYQNPVFSTRLYTGVRWLRLRFTPWLRPLLGFVQIGLFASPELPISSQRHRRREEMLTSDESQSAQIGRGERASSSIENTDMRRANPPGPPSAPLLPSLNFYVGVGALGAPLHRRSPSLYKLPACRITPPDLRTPDIWARDCSSGSRLTQTPTRRTNPSSLRSATRARRCGGTPWESPGEAGERRREAEMTHSWTPRHLTTLSGRASHFSRSAVQTFSRDQKSSHHWKRNVSVHQRSVESSKGPNQRRD